MSATKCLKESIFRKWTRINANKNFIGLFFVTTQRTQKPKDYHHEEHEAHEGRFK